MWATYRFVGRSGRMNIMTTGDREYLEREIRRDLVFLPCLQIEKLDTKRIIYF